MYLSTIGSKASNARPSAGYFLAIVLVLVACSQETQQASSPSSQTPESPPIWLPTERLINAEADSANWLAHGRTYSEARFSPLSAINHETVENLSLAWYFDTDSSRGLEATPIVVDGVMFTSGTWSVVFANDAKTGKLLWKYDPDVPREWGYKACCDIVNRGVAVYEDKVYVGTLDGRLVALDATDGTVVWEVLSIDPEKPYTITGAPRIVNGKVIIGNGGAELGVRGYITAYDAQSGEKAWRFYTVPGNPEEPFENPALKEAAKTWRGGKWWEVGGGGTVWDAMAYDPELNLLYVGVGNGAPWSRYTRSPGGGDNLYLASILAINPDTAELIWHYQTTPGDNWDYTAVQQMILADIDLKGETRQVIMQAPKNGFFYVLDRRTGELLSAQTYVPITWASHVDPETGRPVEAASSNYLDQTRVVRPGPAGGHNWHPMSFSSRTGLVYIPVVENRLAYTQEQDFKYNPDTWNTGIDFLPNSSLTDDFAVVTKIVAWDPVAQTPRWTVDHGRPGASGLLATAGDLVFQPGADCEFNAYDAATGNHLWQTSTQMGTIAAPISYQVDGEQYIAFASGWGGAAGLYMTVPCKDGRRANTGRILAYKLGGSAVLPQAPQTPPPHAPPPLLAATADTLTEGERLYSRHCGFCHSLGTGPSGVIPNLRYISNAAHAEWDAIVLGGSRRNKGMVSFADLLNLDQVRAIQAYVITTAHQPQEEGGENDQ